MTIVEDQEFGNAAAGRIGRSRSPAPPRDGDVQNARRRDRYDFDIDGRGNVLRYTAVLH